MSLNPPESPFKPDSLHNWRSTSSNERPALRIMNGIANESRSPTRLFCGKPDCGLRPILLPIATPLRIPVIDELPPRWQFVDHRDSQWRGDWQQYGPEPAIGLAAK